MDRYLAKNYRMNSLLEFYYPLLTTKQQRYMRCYYVNDYSLGEISRDFHVSRQAVDDNLHRTEWTLENYERQLHLYQRFKLRNRGLNRLHKYVASYYPRDSRLLSIIKNLEHLEDK